MDRMNPMSQLQFMMEQTTPALAYREGEDFAAWRTRAERKLLELLGADGYRMVDPNFRIEWRSRREGYTEIRFVIAVEERFDMPCHLLLPDRVDHPPLIICLQGHSTGMHISLGQPRFPGDEESIAGGRDFGVQAVRLGMAALCLEQRYFGERSEHPDVPGPECWVPSMTELMLGRSALAGRAWDVSRALDAVERHFPAVDTSRVGIMGNSGGGTASWYTACLEPRIGAVMPSCSICTYRKSIAVIRHCMDQHIPGVLRWFEMADLAGLIAPRPLVVVAGRDDEIFPLDGVREAFDRIRELYAAAGAPDACRLVIGEGGHRFYPEQGWPAFLALTGWDTH